MSDVVSKKELETILDSKLGEYQSTILDAVDAGFARVDSGFTGVSSRFDRIEKRLDKLEELYRKLTVTLDAFLKRLTDREDEFTIMKAEIDRIKAVLKDKLGVDVSLQSKGTR